ncbi:hypothetical protein HDV05_004926 [Chytridiales sp. JEL 0842]|nr:hypothetical protein HDV05_004926 [Chytridiales sp. JEL 0842]
MGRSRTVGRPFCELCLRVFDDATELSDHLAAECECPTSDRTCWTCGEVFKNKQECGSHLDSCKGPLSPGSTGLDASNLSIVPCPVRTCLYKLDSVFEFEEHYRTIHCREMVAPVSHGSESSPSSTARNISPIKSPQRKHKVIINSEIAGDALGTIVGDNLSQVSPHSTSLRPSVQTTKPIEFGYTKLYLFEGDRVVPIVIELAPSVKSEHYNDRIQDPTFQGLIKRFVLRKVASNQLTGEGRFVSDSLSITFHKKPWRLRDKFVFSKNGYQLKCEDKYFFKLDTDGFFENDDVTPVDLLDSPLFSHDEYSDSDDLSSSGEELDEITLQKTGITIERSSPTPPNTSLPSSGRGTPSPIPSSASVGQQGGESSESNTSEASTPVPQQIKEPASATLPSWLSDVSILTESSTADGGTITESRTSLDIEQQQSIIASLSAINPEGRKPKKIIIRHTKVPRGGAPASVEGGHPHVRKTIVKRSRGTAFKNSLIDQRIITPIRRLFGWAEE